MSFESSRFGATTTSTAVVTQTNTHYNQRFSTRAQGVVKTEGSVNLLSVEVSGEDVSNESFVLLAPRLPAGAKIEKVWVTVKEALTLGGTSPAISVGTEGSESTNGFDISEAQAEAAGTYDVTSTLAGTWGAPLAAETVLGIDLTGTSPTSADTGLLEFVVEYFAPNA